MSVTAQAIVAKITNKQPIPGADRIVQAEVLGETVIVSVNQKEDEIGIFFPAGLALSREFCLQNKLYRKHPDTDEPMGGYLESNARVRFVRMKGVVSRGLWLPMSCMDEYVKQQTFVDPPLELGIQFDTYANQQICWKYISPDQKEQIQLSKNGKVGKAKSIKYKNFYEVGDTSRMTYNLHTLKQYSDIVITEKLHGTSGRTGYLPIKKTPNWFDKLMSKIGFERPAKYGVVTGTRRMVLGENSPSKEKFRRKIQNVLAPYLEQGQIVYYEIVGFDENGKSIMPPHNHNNKPMYYYYGVPPSTTHSYDFYIYRIVGHNEQGTPYEYSWDQVVEWCEQRGLKHVPVLDRFTYNGMDRNSFMDRIKTISDGTSSLDQRHIREGVCVRIKDKVYKHKGDTFCYLEDINPYTDPEDLQ